VGAFFSPLICGTLGEIYGWHYGFSAAGVGMIIGLSIYLLGQRWLAPDSLMERESVERKPVKSFTRDEKKSVWGLIAVCLISVAFWAAYEQQGNTVAVWADVNTNRHVFGWEFPASWFQSLNPAFVFLFTPLVIAFWSWQSRKRKEPSAVSKMAVGCFLLASSFLVMIPAAMTYEMVGTPVSMWWLVSFTLLATLGELYLSPVGLSLVTKLAPARIVSMMMGVWFAASFLGNYAAGFLGTYWERMNKDVFFLMIAVIAFAAGLAILMILRPLKRAIGPGHDM
jgi:POT family proton-dependent oligopeptide transporter